MNWKEGRGDSVPRQAPAPRFRIAYPRPGEPLEVRLLDHTFIGFDCHWLPAHGNAAARTILCEHPDPCTCDQQPLPFKWHGYIGAVNLRRGDYIVLSLTQRGVIALQDVAGEEATLQGLRIALRRATEHASSRLIINVLEERVKGTCPPAFDLVPSLECVYGRDALARWSSRNRGKDGAS